MCTIKRRKTSAPIRNDRNEYLKNKFFTKHEYGDFTPFYITITICSILGGFLFVLNIAFCWCSRHRRYWRDRHTGNRWVQPLWTVLPHKTPPLDLSELEYTKIDYPELRHTVQQYDDPELQAATAHHQEYMEMQKRESEI